MSSNDHHALADCKPVLVEKTEHTRETTPLKSPEDTKIKVLSINEDLEQKEQKAAGAEHKNRGFDQGKVQLDKQKWMARGLAMSKEHDEKTDETQVRHCAAGVLGFTTWFSTSLFASCGMPVLLLMLITMAQTDQTKHNTSHEIPQEDRTKVGVQSQVSQRYYLLASLSSSPPSQAVELLLHKNPHRRSPGHYSQHFFPQKLWNGVISNLGICQEELTRYRLGRSLAKP